MECVLKWILQCTAWPTPINKKIDYDKRYSGNTVWTTNEHVKWTSHHHGNRRWLTTDHFRTFKTNENLWTLRNERAVCSTFNSIDTLNCHIIFTYGVCFLHPANRFGFYFLFEKTEVWFNKNNRITNESHAKYALVLNVQKNAKNTNMHKWIARCERKRGHDSDFSAKWSALWLNNTEK